MKEFDDIFSKYSPFVFRYLLSLSGNTAVAEELTSETLYRAYINIDKYRGESKFETWLCAIAKNEYFKDCKRKSRIVSIEEIPEQPDISNFTDRFLEKEQAILIYRKVHELDEQYKEVILLRVLGELNFKEIANIFGKSESWAKVTFFRAKNKIIEKMEGEQ